jgi:preprotein translocase subunit SecE
VIFSALGDRLAAPGASSFEEWIEMAKTSPAQFVREVRQEISKVTWPSRKELTVTTISVLVMSALAALFFFLVDQLIALVIRLILGLGG